MTTKLVSIIIPTFNEELRLETCLKSIRKQKYPRSKIELIIVDDGSTDKTISIAKKYKAKIYNNGSKNIERGKSIGLSKAKGEYLFFIDADNALTSSSDLPVAISILNNHSEVAGVQWWRFKYNKRHNIANRYCELYGINDPFVFYMKKRGLLMQTEDSWLYPDTVIENHKKYVITQYRPDNLPTLGSQGYLTRKKLLKKTQWSPFLFHLDSVADLVSSHINTFALLKADINHDYANSLEAVLKKLHRNIKLFWKYKDKRRYTYRMKLGELILTILLMVTFIVPTYHALKGYTKKPDIAWFVHPILCFLVVVLYAYETLKAKLKFLSNNMIFGKSI